ncbi:hypothetical protein L207DRAFT_585272 [Hyaloscypha variabilis F]|uniref:BTB domain-containing protein n=1 Tax=Hyaloscypha variabilis (strain UAMH 11265 / GT02V1 / F) TaxID=1149755 RepID=A0A2J6RIP4_HYAVF|nr:hypothetical protein L207DRAFT_585272 [Hyaloscypha variabilis F]
MASAPPAKKQKVAAYAKAAIEYHVHSILLKLYSEFFRKFLDSPDKITGERAAGSGFRYFWATEVDQDGKDCHLAAVSSQNSERLGTTYRGAVDYQQHLFKTLLCAIYNKPYTFRSADELLDLTKMADYYRALPILSRTLDGAMVNSPYLMEDIKGSASALLVAAVKLRNALLFRECVVWTVSIWSNREPEKDIVDPKLRIIERKGIRDRFLVDLREDIETATEESYDDDSESILLPEYFRKLREGLYNMAITDSLREVCKTNLVLNKNIISGSRGYESKFFCAEIGDDELPWTIDETSW